MASTNFKKELQNALQNALQKAQDEIFDLRKTIKATLEEAAIAEEEHSDRVRELEKEISKLKKKNAKLEEENGALKGKLAERVALTSPPQMKKVISVFTEKFGKEPDNATDLENFDQKEPLKIKLASCGEHKLFLAVGSFSGSWYLILKTRYFIYEWLCEDLELLVSNRELRGVLCTALVEFQLENPFWSLTNKSHSDTLASEAYEKIRHTFFPHL
ncbi:MAG: hypothetical protein EBQ92_00210 [Proteobacteria bacterium]|nr:hypothetical protein [Pseudomonadota bacterium]